MKSLFEATYSATTAFDEKLRALKASRPDIAWYPFNTMAKVNLMAKVTDYFGALPALGGRPRVLDVGAADGDLSFLFESVGCEVTAIDNPHSNNNRCTGIEAMKTMLGSSVNFQSFDIDFDTRIEGKHDLVVFLDVFYHLRNPIGALMNLSRVGRYMFFSTRICDVAMGGEKLAGLPVAYLLAPMEAAANDPTNYWIFTETGLNRIFERSGWKVLKTLPFGHTGSDSNPASSSKDKRVFCLCEAMPGAEHLRERHFLPSATVG